MENRPKISEIYENKVQTRTERNQYGQWEQVQKEFRYKRPVNDLTAGLRFVNLLIDFTVIQTAAYLLGQIESINENPIAVLIFNFLIPIYYIVGEYYFQQTIGKFFTNSIVINEYGDRPDFKTVIVRTAIRCIPIEAFSYFSQNRGWHDRWTDTYVVKKDELERIELLMLNPENLVP
jgi:uncharacterized RDD family membrane protein YckC